MKILQLFGKRKSSHRDEKIIKDTMTMIKTQIGVGVVGVATTTPTTPTAPTAPTPPPTLAQ